MRLSIRPARLGAAAAAAMLLALPLAGRAEAVRLVTQDRLAPTGMTEGTAASAQLTVHSLACITARTVGVAVRDGAGRNLDFPGAATNVRICPGGVTITTGSRALPAGTYTAFGYWQDYANAWHDLAQQTLTVAPSSTGPTPPGPTPTPDDPDIPLPGGSLVWSEEFDGSIAWGSKWVGDRSSAYRYGDHNPDDNKLDLLNPGAVETIDGVAVFTATRSEQRLENGRRAWETGLLTTEGSDEGFRVHAGDYVETKVQLPEGAGAWPALWTWRNGGSEVDSFEYHPDNPHLLELTNHVRRGAKYYTDADAVAPGKWVTIGTRYGTNSVDWYVNGERVWSDGRGVGQRWSAYLILNLSVVAGKYHPGPEGAEPITAAADYVRVYR
ncbi:hypothetical protein [Kitasatospora arboriphila]|uniref:GH16 domain-containing protein n=1 Tax=Kitasatospora arboriphila TaxID=258052 RepID=A0ABN1U4G1_9ACTN